MLEIAHVYIANALLLGLVGAQVASESVCGSTAAPAEVKPTDRAATQGSWGRVPGRAANHVGVTRQTLNAIERGKYSPSLEVAFRIARFFKVGLDDVFAYDDDT